MKNWVKRTLSVFVSLCLIASGSICALAETDLGLTWPSDLSGAPDWAVNATESQQAATIQAINDEYNAQLAAGYSLGTVESFGNYGGMVDVQFSGGDNTGNPWGHANRRWGIIVAPYAGMAFSVKSYFAEHFSFSNVLNDEFQWTDPTTGVTKVYQMTASNVMCRDVDGTVVTNEGRAPGAGSTDSSSIASMQYAIAKSSSEGYNIGFGAANAKAKNGYLYQEFFGPDSTGASAQVDRGLDKNYGISYVVANADDAFIITDKIFTAWAGTWGDLDTNNPDRFSASGMPTSNAYTDTDGSVCQDFENFRIRIAADGTVNFDKIGHKVLSVSGSLVENALMDGSSISLLVSGSDLSAVTLNFTLSDGATASIANGTVVDLTSPVQLTVTNAIRQQVDYTITAYTDSTLTVSQKAAALAVQEKVNVLPDYIYASDRENAQAAVDSYDALSTAEKLLVTGSEKIEAARARLAVIGTGQIRITCVGDSITQGIGSSNESVYSYPAQLQTKLGDGYVVTNAGVSGAFASESSCSLPYIVTSGYPTGLSSDPDLVFMMLGTNDANNTYWNQTTVDFPALFEQGYRNLIEQYLDLPSSPKIVLCLPMSSFTSDGRETNNVNGTIPIIQKLAAEYGLDILDMHSYTAGHQDWFGDNLHPTDQGYDYVSDKFEETVNEIMANNAVAVTGITLDGTALENFSAATTEYTVPVNSYHFPEIAISSDNGCKYSVTAATKANPTAYIHVEAPVGNDGITYVIHYDVDTVIGDITGEGQVTVADVVELRDVIMKGTVTDAQLAACDFNDDSSLTVSDVVDLRDYIMKGVAS